MSGSLAGPGEESPVPDRRWAMWVGWLAAFDFCGGGFLGLQIYGSGAPQLLSLLSLCLGVVLAGVLLGRWGSEARVRDSSAPGALLVTGDVISQITSAVIGFFASIWNGIQAFFGQIFGALANTFSAIFLAPVNVINASFATLGAWSQQFGPFAPLLVVIIVGLVILLGVFFLFLAIRIATSEGEQEVGEVEEGT